MKHTLNFNGKTIAIVAHKASQLALDVIIKNISWKEAIDKDWRKTGNWQPGWKYEINELPSLLIFKDKNLLGKIEGYYSVEQKEDLINLIKEII